MDVIALLEDFLETLKLLPLYDGNVEMYVYAEIPMPLSEEGTYEQIYYFRLCL